MMEWLRDEPINIALPPDCRNRTLTIAQSFPDYSETSTPRAVPATVKLYCGYAYESQLISESFLLAVMSAAFVISAVMLFACVRHKDVSFLCLAVTTFLLMTLHLCGASFFYKYYGTMGNTIYPVLRLLTGITLLIFLGSRAVKYRKVIWSLTILSAAATAGMLVWLLLPPHTATEAILALLSVPYWIGFAGMISALVICCMNRKESPFCRLFVPAALAAVAVNWSAILFARGPASLIKELRNMLASGEVEYIYMNNLPSLITAALFAAAAEIVHREINRLAEKRLLAQRYEMTQASYENMRLHQEEVSMLRHDMAKHYLTLYGIADENRRTAYLAELLGQNEKIRPVFGSGNEMIDIIVGSSMRTAADAGIEFEVVRASVPEKLPVRNADLCALVMNLMDNAVHAAAKSGAEKPFIRLDLHIKNDLFVFTCRNSTGISMPENDAQNETTPKCGLGLKIVSQIVEKNGIMTQTGRGPDYYEVTLVIPLNQALRYQRIFV